MMARIALALALFATCDRARAVGGDAPVSTAEALHAIAHSIEEKAKAGNVTAQMLAPDLAAIDALLAQHPGKSEDSAQIALAKAAVYWRILKDDETSRRLFTAILQDYEGTAVSAIAREVLNTMTPEAKTAAEAREAKLQALVGQPAPELHFRWSSQPGLATLSSLKGQVVVLDFWATWCGPCIASFPQLREDVAHFAGVPVVFLGVTSLQGVVSNLGPKNISTKGDPAKEIALMPDFMKAKNVTWVVGISEEPVFNPDYRVDAIPAVVIIAPDGTVRHSEIGDLEISAKVTALLREFNLPVPHD